MDDLKLQSEQFFGFQYIDDLGYEISRQISLWKDEQFEAYITIVRLPNGREIPFFHLRTERPMTGQMLKRALKAWPIIKANFGYPMMIIYEDDNPRRDRFCELFGNKYLETVPCTDGKNRRLYTTT